MSHVGLPFTCVEDHKTVSVKHKPHFSHYHRALWALSRQPKFFKL